MKVKNEKLEPKGLHVGTAHSTIRKDVIVI
jgi:hypothetical protein